MASLTAYTPTSLVPSHDIPDFPTLSNLDPGSVAEFLADWLTWAEDACDYSFLALEAAEEIALLACERAGGPDGDFFAADIPLLILDERGLGWYYGALSISDLAEIERDFTLWLRLRGRLSGKKTKLVSSWISQVERYFAYVSSRDPESLDVGKKAA